MTFWWRSLGGVLHLQINDFFTKTLRRENHGEWRFESFTLSKGEQLLQWFYSDFNPAGNPAVAAWLDEVTWGNTTTATTWGTDDFGLNEVPSAAKDITAVAAGADHNLVLKSSGHVEAWGNDEFEQASVPEDLCNIAAIAAGDGFSLALTKEGELRGWGRDDEGQLDFPEELGVVTMVAAGGGHVIAVLEDGTVEGWGRNDQMQASPPDSVVDPVAIAAGGEHSLALLEDGDVVGWGRNDEEQIEAPEDLTEVAAIVAGRNHSMALLEDGTPVGWGDNSFGQLDLLGTGASAQSVGKTGARPKFTAPIAIIASGPAADHTLALDANGELVARGRNDADQTNVPEDLKDVLAIAAGARHSLALVDTAALPGDEEPGDSPVATLFDAEELGQGFYSSSWYGTFAADLFPWIFHLQHGFQYAPYKRSW